MEAVISKYLRSVLVTAFQLGQQHPNSNPEEFIPSLNRRSFTKSLIREGRAIYQDVLNQYKRYRYIALAVDAGKLGSMNYFDILLCNALTNINPILFKAYQYFLGTLNDYEQKLEDAINAVQEEGLIVTGIVSDCLRVQTAAIYNIISVYPGIIFVPCGAHAVHNGIKDAISANPDLRMMVTTLESFVILTNSKPILGNLKVSTPKRCITRWTNIYDIALYIVKHRDSYISFLENPQNHEIHQLRHVFHVETFIETVNRIAPTLAILLHPLYVLSQKLENDRSSFAFTYGYEAVACIKLEEIARKYPSLADEANILAKSIHDRLHKGTHGACQALAFSLTAQGRDIMIEEFKREKNTELIKGLFAERFDYDTSIDHIEEMYEILQHPFDFPNGNQFLSILREEHIAKREAAKETQAKLSKFLDDQQILVKLQNQVLSGTISQEQYLEQIHENQLEQYLERTPPQPPQEKEAELEYHPSDSSSDETDSEFPDDPVNDLLNSELTEEFADAPVIFHTLIEKTYNFKGIIHQLKDIANRFGLDAEKAVVAYSKWIQTPSSLPSEMLYHLNYQNVSTYDMWNFYEKFDEFTDLAIIALRLITIPSSEASCERTFWKQRKILTDERARTGENLAFARLVIMSQIE